MLRFLMISFVVASFGLVVLKGPHAEAHMVYVVPTGEGNEVMVIFSDDLFPDTRVNIGRLSGIKLMERSQSGDESPLTLQQEEGRLRGKLAAAPRVVHGSVNYGISTRGDKPALVHYHPKFIAAGVSTSEAKLGKASPLEIVPVSDGRATRFRLFAEGVPVADAEGSIFLPNETTETVKTDKDGYTPPISAEGRYAISFRVTSAKSGTHEGEAYEEVRVAASLVMDLGSSRE